MLLTGLNKLGTAVTPLSYDWSEHIHAVTGSISIVLPSPEKEACTERGQNQENHAGKLLAFYFWRCLTSGLLV